MASITIFGTPVRIKPVVAADFLAVCLLAAWVSHRTHPLRGAAQSTLVGLCAMVILAAADFGHAIAHIVSARLARAPMDQVLISAGMPRTLYTDNAVPPRAHRLRAAGGPIFNAAGLLVSLLLMVIVPGGSLGAELLAWSAVGNGLLLFGSLLPLPIVDGGVLLKWTLIERGMTEAQADRLVRRIDGGIAVALAAAGCALVVTGPWVVGLACLAGAIVVGAIGAGRIR